MYRWLIWSSFVVAWTIALELPFPEPGELPGGEFVVGRKYLFTKTLHVLVYAVFAGLSGWVRVAMRYRFAMMFGVVGHAWGTEILQEALEPWCHRGGSLSDVGFDMIGIVLGTAATWKWWTHD